jgi:predicted XRE-type DNA-binding protein
MAYTTYDIPTDRDEASTPSSGNIYADLGLPDADAHQFKAHVVMLIASVMQRHKLTQTEAARRMGIKQPDLSNILRGRFRGYSLERLLACARAIGIDFEIRAKPSTDAAHEGRLELKVA